MTFEEAVARLRVLAATDATATAAVKQARFEMGDLAVQHAPVTPNDGSRNGSYAVLHDLADRSGVPFSSLVHLRYIASRIPADQRLDGSAPTPCTHRSRGRTTRRNGCACSP